MSQHRRNDKARRPHPPFRAFAERRQPAATGDWLWGTHAVLAALANPARAGPLRLLATAERARELPPAWRAAAEILPAPELSRRLPAGAVHQGLALDAPPLVATPLSVLAEDARGVLLMLDQVTDPQNVGTIFRSAAALGAGGVILQDRHAPRLAGALAKAAAGAIDQIPHAREVNLARALEKLADAGWRAVGLDRAAGETLAEALDARPTVLVLGSEGEGLRRLVREHCDSLAAIPMGGGFESLNVAAAAAIALYEAGRVRAAGP